VLLLSCCIGGARFCVEIRLRFSWSCLGWCVLVRPCDVSDNGLVGIVGVLFFPLFLLFPFFPFGVFCVQKDIYTGKSYSVDCF